MLIAVLPGDPENINKMLIVTFLLLTKMKLLPEGKESSSIKRYTLAKGQNEPRMDIKLNIHNFIF